MATHQAMGNKPLIKSLTKLMRLVDLILFYFGVVAQSAERFLCKEEDMGSSPIYSTIDSGFPHSMDVDNPEWIRNSAPFLPGPRKTTIKQLRLERDGYSITINKIMRTYQWMLISSMPVAVSLKRGFESLRPYNKRK